MQGRVGMPDIQALMAQAAEMQAAMADKQQALAEETFEGSAGGGMVVAVVTGAGDLVSMQVDPAVLDPDDPELVGDLVVAAVNQAMAGMREAAASTLGIGPAAGGLDLGSLSLDDLGGLLG
ncbi:MAG: YbaB/EbfC family nucleoid-associated protein [Actinobacteria bacterium]|nr:YbaB/EbfC family nucleoid-associated protein [Actinomycetota bacterium]MBU1864920.1 YbaB/EbfC family nucleoid-associated protein [Actinomycetota bacterium]